MDGWVEGWMGMLSYLFLVRLSPCGGVLICSAAAKSKRMDGWMDGWMDGFGMDELGMMLLGSLLFGLSVDDGRGEVG